MSPSKMSVDEISVHIAFHDTPLVFPIRDTTVVEDIIIAVCYELGISPVTRTLFALKNSALGHNAWLSMAQTFNDDKIRNYEFAMRFKVPDLDYLMAIDRNTYNFYYKQVKHSVLHSLIPTLNLKSNESRVIGLCVTDMIRAIVEDGLSKSEVIRCYRKYVPARIQKKHPFFLKKPIKLKIEEVRIKNLDSYYLKMSYLETFNLLAPDYLVEEYSALSVFPGDRLYTTIIRVDPFDRVLPGIAKKDEHKEWEHVCSIEDLCFMSTAPTGMVEIWRKNGICVTFKFPMATDIVSFATLLDGYYRLTCKWTFNLCKNLQTPSLLRLFALKCHGPVGDPFAYKKLFEKMNNEVGSYLLRESSVEYDAWFIDVCLEAGKGPTTLKITRTIDGRYKLSGEEGSYSSMSSLILSHRNEKTDVRLLHCLPPSEYDNSILLLCRTENYEPDRPKEDKPSTEPVCIDAKALLVHQNTSHLPTGRYGATLPRKGRSTCTTVYGGTWKTANREVKNVAVKVLHQDEVHTLMPEFCSHSKWSFMNTNSTIRIFGMTLANPIALVMEYAALGPLDEYLANSQHLVSDLNLVEAAASLANALYYLAEANYVHGYVRCCKVLVMAHTDLSLSVRLAHQGLTVPYIDFDLHWIPPEYHEKPHLAHTNMSSDIWAYATTLWEIFSLGTFPEIRTREAIKKFYREPTNYLPRPARCSRSVYELMMNCWERDRHARKTAQGIMRDINHIYYQLHNAKSYHPYSTISCHRADHDNVSNGSKASGDYNVSVLSTVTQNTLLDDGDESSSDDLGFHLPKKVGSGSYCTLPARHELISQLEENVTRKLERQKSADLEQEELPRPIAPSSEFDMDERFDLDKDWVVVKKGLIGEGYYGEVFRADLNAHYDHKLTKQCVVKQLKADFFASSGELQKELQIMSQLDHPNIVKLIGFIQEPHPLLVLEYLERGSLKNHIIVHSAWTDSTQLIKWALNIAMGMRYLHEHSIVHRDLSARNILVDENCVKIADFGLARFIGDENYYYYQRPNRILPIKWYAPESIEKCKFSYQSDVWSYGVTLWEMFSPNAEPDLPDIGTKAPDICAALNRGVRLDKPDRCPKFVYDEVMTPCWKQVASERPTFEDLEGVLSNALALETTTRTKEEEEKQPDQVDDCNLSALIAKTGNGIINASPSLGISVSNNNSSERKLISSAESTSINPPTDRTIPTTIASANSTSSISSKQTDGETSTKPYDSMKKLNQIKNPVLKFIPTTNPESVVSTYRVKDADRGSTCILMTVDALISFLYVTNLNLNEESDVFVPDEKKIELAGECDDEESSMSLKWKSFVLKFEFYKTPGGERWYVNSIQLSFNTKDTPMQHPNHPNTLVEAKTTEGDPLFPTPVGRSFKCHREIKIALTDPRYPDLNVVLMLRELTLEPFIFKNDDFGSEYMCTAAGSGSFRSETAPFIFGSLLSLASICTVAIYAIYRYLKVNKVQYDAME